MRRRIRAIRDWRASARRRIRSGSRARSRRMEASGLPRAYADALPRLEVLGPGVAGVTSAYTWGARRKISGE